METHFLKKSGTAAIAIIFAVFLAAIHTYASQEELALFDQGYGYYLSYEPEKAVESFHVFLNEFPDSSAKDAALFWLGRSFVSLRRYEEAKQIFSKLKQEIPDSPFIMYAEKELETINTPDAGKETKTAIEKIDSEIQALRNEKARTDKILTQITEERDNLRFLLEEEKIKMRALEADASRFDGELKEILARLQTLRKDHENNNATVTTSQNQIDEPVAVLQEVTKEATAESDERVIPNDTVQGTEQEQRNQVEDPHKNEKAYPVIQQSSSHTLELIANEETWISVTIDDRESRERLLKPGARVKWTAKSGFSLRIGNAGGTKIIFNGQDIGPLGEKGKVVKLKLPSLKLSTSHKEPSKVL
ncbi:MAG: hypothetical protein AMK74_07030 [Nitrospira bacterium SM23_35]|nr:MAG: hypothetical protein AMK74_07030 [Nitrospira bacterium SM23_35]